MKIAIIGTGNVGSALAQKLSQAGHIIFLGVREVSNFKNKELLSKKITALSVTEAVLNAEVVIIAVPADAAALVAELITPIVGDKVIIDTTNVVMKGPEGYSSGFEAIKSITRSLHVIKCFNSTGAENIFDPKYGDNILDMFIAGGSTVSKEVATKLAQDVGFENIYDFGDDSKVPLLEQFALAWINLAIFQKQGRNIGVKILIR